MAQPEKNVLGGELRACSYSPLTGYFRDGCCATQGEDGVAHLVCVQVTDRKSTRLNSSHVRISYAVFCLKKKKHTTQQRLCCTCAGRRLVLHPDSLAAR